MAREPAETDWRHHAACRRHDPELFFPVGNTGPALDQIEAAKAVCHGCRVLRACQEYVWTWPRLAEHGVWGGLSEGERRVALHHRRRLGGRTQARP
jgi:WhiB family redox-sensing transcriptional regulator